MRPPAIVPTVETLIKAGAFDSFGARRSQLTAVIDRAMQSGAAAVADRRSGQKSLFGDLEEDEAGRPGRAARYPGMGGTRTAGDGEGSARVLSLEPSAGRIREDVVHVLLPHARPDWPTCRIARKSFWAA